MAIGKNAAVVSQLRALFNVGTFRELTDGQLLERFATDRSEAAELAFSVLVERHGPMVLRVCRAELADPHDTEDAFQAAFLVLVKKARGLWVRDSLGPWLHQVAYRTACCARLAAARRRRHEGRAAESREESYIVSRDELGGILHEEIDKLPERFRAPVVLCDLEGRTHAQAARHLGWPIGTVKSRQARGRERLRDRLRRRGFAQHSGLIGSGFVPTGPLPTVSAALVDSTTRAVVRFLTCRSAVRASTLSLAQEVFKAMSLTRWSKVAFVVLIMGATVSGAGVLAQKRGGAAPPPTKDKLEPARGDDIVTFQVQRGKFAATVIERGSLEVSRSQDVVCMVEGSAVIISIVPEGTHVKRGETVCELDSASLKDQLVNQRIATENAEHAYQIANNAREAAEMAVTEYTEGTFKQELNTAKAAAAVARSAIQKAESRLERVRRARQRLSELLAPRKDGMSPSDILAELDIEDRLDATVQTLLRERTALELAKSKQETLEKYTRDRTIKELGAVAEEKRANALARRDICELAKNKERKLERQIAACVIVAPANGVVVYASDPRRVLIEEGAAVRERQKILSVIDLNDPLQVNTKVRESQVDRVARKMKAKIRIDAFPDRVFDGTVVEVAALPDASSRLRGELTVYTTKVRIENGVPDLRRGMTAEVEILVDERDNVLSVPVQALVRSDGKDQVAVKKARGAIEWRDVIVGITNDKFVEIKHGIESGETVILNPAAVMSDQEKHDKLGVPSSRCPRFTRLRESTRGRV
jgi:HlyD family secretion protein